VVVLNTGPLLLLNVGDKFLLVLVNGETDQTHVAAPVAASLLQHLLVMSHWLLARWAPSCPKVEQQDLTRLVFELSAAFNLLPMDVNLVHVGQHANLISNAVLTLHLDLLTLRIEN